MNCKACAFPYLRFDGDLATVTLGDKHMGEGEALAAATTWLFGREEHIVDTIEIILRDAAPVVFDLQPCLLMIMG